MSIHAITWNNLVSQLQVNLSHHGRLGRVNEPLILAHLSHVFYSFLLFQWESHTVPVSEQCLVAVRQLKQKRGEGTIIGLHYDVIFIPREAIVSQSFKIIVILQQFLKAAS